MDKKDKEALAAESPFTAENREPKALVTVGGLALTEGGKVTTSRYLAFLGQDIDRYDDIVLTPDEAARIHQHLAKLSTGATAMVPLYCGGDKCPFKDRCPLYKIGKAPIARQCLIESQLLKEYVLRYYDEFDIDPTNWTEVGYVNELAEIDIYLLRLNMLIARPENAELVIDQTMAVAHDGTPIIQKQISPFMDQKDKLVSRRSRIIKLMVGDRQEKYKKEAALKMRINQDAASLQSSTRAKLEQLQSAITRLGNESPPTAPKKTVSPEDLIDGNIDLLETPNEPTKK